MQLFFDKLGVKDIYYSFNMIELGKLDYTCRSGAKCINSITASKEMLEHVVGSKLFEIHEIVNID